MNTSNNNLVEFLLEKFEALKEFFYEHIKLIVPIIVGVIAIIAVLIGLSAHIRKEKAEAEAAAAEAALLAQESPELVLTIPDIPIEENAYPEVNDLISKYYLAMSNGDTDIIKSMNNFINDTELIRIEETSKYIEHYQNVSVYTKKGPAEGTFLAYVYSEIKFTDYTTAVPGIKAFYICTDENGSLFINDGEESETVISYIREVSLQDDMVDLNNEVAVKYNDMLAEDENLAVFLVDLTASIDTAVGERLALAEGSEETEEEPEEDENSDNQTEVTATVVTKVKTTTTVNVRSSDSETADKLGKASEGQEFVLIEERGNGWSEIEYNGKSAFIKSEFLEATATETVVTVTDNTETEEETEDTQTTTTTTTTNNSSSNKVTGKVKVKENVRIRSGASETSEKVATAYVGQELDLIQKQADGWTKIMYNGEVAYVKSDYVE